MNNKLTSTELQSRLLQGNFDREDRSMNGSPIR